MKLRVLLDLLRGSLFLFIHLFIYIFIYLSIFLFDKLIFFILFLFIYYVIACHFLFIYRLIGFACRSFSNSPSFITPTSPCAPFASFPSSSFLEQESKKSHESDEAAQKAEATQRREKDHFLEEILEGQGLGVLLMERLEKDNNLVKRVFMSPLRRKPSSDNISSRAHRAALACLIKHTGRTGQALALAAVSQPTSGSSGAPPPVPLFPAEDEPLLQLWRLSLAVRQQVEQDEATLGPAILERAHFLLSLRARSLVVYRSDPAVESMPPSPLAPSLSASYSSSSAAVSSPTASSSSPSSTPAPLRSLSLKRINSMARVPAYAGHSDTQSSSVPFLLALLKGWSRDYWESSEF